MKKEELIYAYNYHYKQADLIDDQLAEMCKDSIKQLVESGKIKEAKIAVNEFYNGLDTTIGKDMIIANLNKRLTPNK